MIPWEDMDDDLMEQMEKTNRRFVLEMGVVSLLILLAIALLAF